MPAITEPGLYQDFDEDEYHADPLPEPSASRSILKAIVEKTPRHAFVAHPRLDPDFERAENDKFDLGKAVHTLVLGRGQKIAVGEYSDYRSKAAQEWRDAARNAGLTPMLQEQADRALAMEAAIREQLPDHGLEHLFNPANGRAEVVAAWRDPVGGWSRCLIDWLEKDLTITDLKTTEVDMTVDALGRHCSSMGYEYQHALYERAIVNLYPEMEGRVKFRFLFAEAKKPFAILPITLPNDALAMGRANVELGMQRWAAAKASGKWPRYSGGDRAVEYPPWAVAEFAK